MLAKTGMIFLMDLNEFSCYYQQEIFEKVGFTIPFRDMMQKAEWK